MTPQTQAVEPHETFEGCKGHLSFLPVAPGLLVFGSILDAVQGGDKPGHWSAGILLSAAE
jgi:hypothetical protein